MALGNFILRSYGSKSLHSIIVDVKKKAVIIHLLPYPLDITVQSILRYNNIREGAYSISSRNSTGKQTSTQHFFER
jgi:hypothetical protein